MILIYGPKEEIKNHFGKSLPKLKKKYFIKLIDNPEKIKPLLKQTKLFITWRHFIEKERELFFKCRNNNIPSLLLADGILEWNNIWYSSTKPDVTPGSNYQPILANKMSCLGRSQARLLEAWGNKNKCEIIGSPRFDKYLKVKKRKRDITKPFRILIATAKTPAFDKQHLNLVMKSLKDIKTWLQTNQQINNIKIEPVWRLTQELHLKLNVKNNLANLLNNELLTTLKNVDAVITTPSSLMLEAFLLKLPVAIINYKNTPLLTPAVWEITSRSHIKDIILELISPSAKKMLLQETILNDSLECSSPSWKRLYLLIKKMHSLFNKQKNKKIKFPKKLLPYPDTEKVEEKHFDLAKYYPNNNIFNLHNHLLLQQKTLHYQRLASQQENKLKKFLTKEKLFDNAIYIEKYKIKLNQVLLKKTNNNNSLKLLVYGTGSLLFSILPVLLKHKIKIVSLVKTTPKKNSFLGYKLISPKKIPLIPFDYILIASNTYKKELINHLNKLNVPKSKIITL